MSMEDERRVQSDDAPLKNGMDAFYDEESWRRVVRAIIRSLLITLAIYLIWLTAIHWLPNRTAVLLGGEPSDWVRVAIAGLAGAASLALLQSVVQLPNRIWDLMLSLPQRSWNEFRRRCLGVVELVLVPTVCLFFAIGLGQETSDPLKAEGTSNILKLTREAMRLQGYTASRAERLDHIGVKTRESNDYFARFPVAFQGGELPNDVTATNIDLEHIDFEKGLKFVSQPDALLAGLVKALTPCGSPKRKVRLRIEGYASSQPFPGIGLDQSVRLNVHLANQRAERVAEVLTEILEASDDARKNFDDLDVAVYRELWEMESDREFNDRPFGVASDDDEAPPQDFLTRAAHVKVMNAANCAVEVAESGQ